MRSSSSNFKEDLQNEQKCPITKKSFKDPVVAMDGYTYERKAILKWFEKNQTSPKTKQSLASKLIIPNNSFKNMITNIIPRFMTSYERKKQEIQRQIQYFQQQSRNYENICQQIIVKQSNKTEQLKNSYQKRLVEKERQIQQIKLHYQNKSKRNEKQLYQLKERYQKEIQQIKNKKTQILYERQIRQLQKQIEYLKLNQNPMRMKQRQIVYQKDQYQKEIKQEKYKDQNSLLGLPKKKQKLDPLIANNNKGQKEQRKLAQQPLNQQNNFIKNAMNKNHLAYTLKKQIDYEVGLNSLLRQSSILDRDKLQLLIKWLVKPIVKIQFKFKASRNEFKMNRFYDSCGNLNNIIIIAKTTKGKIIGGYTPLSFNPPGNEWTNSSSDSLAIKDNSNQSFLFSLSERYKFQLKNDNYAIRRYKDKNVIQFYLTFQIWDNSNTSKNGSDYRNQFNLGNNYYNLSKYASSKIGYIETTGQKNKQFLTQQWQAYQVFFQ